MAAVRIPIAHRANQGPPRIRVMVRISSLEKKPDKSGRPERAAAPQRKVTQVVGMCRARPPILCMSCSSCMPWMTEPAPRKSRPLKKAWVTRWKMAAPKAPAPQARNMYPSWLTVE